VREQGLSIPKTSGADTNVDLRFEKCLEIYARRAGERGRSLAVANSSRSISKSVDRPDETATAKTKRNAEILDTSLCSRDLAGDPLRDDIVPRDVIRIAAAENIRPAFGNGGGFVTKIDPVAMFAYNRHAAVLIAS